VPCAERRQRLFQLLRHGAATVALRSAAETRRRRVRAFRVQPDHGPRKYFMSARNDSLSRFARRTRSCSTVFAGASNSVRGGNCNEAVPSLLPSGPWHGTQDCRTRTRGWPSDRAETELI